MSRIVLLLMAASVAAEESVQDTSNMSAGFTIRPTRIGGHPCRVYTPAGDGPFPAVPFFHGFGAEGAEGYERIMGRLAKEGFIGVLVTDCGTGCGSPGGPWAAKWVNDVVSGLQAAKLEKFNGVVGIAGHSMGGAVACAYSNTYGITSPVKGAVMVHEGLCNLYKLEEMTLPAVFITGTADIISNDKGVEKGWTKYAAKQKVYVDVKGSTHFSINDGAGMGKEDDIVVLSLRCFLNADSAACRTVWTGLDKVTKLAAYEHVGNPPHSGQPMPLAVSLPLALSPPAVYV